MTTQFNGVIHGSTITLTGSPGMADGQEVVVIVRPASKRPWGEGIRSSAGAFGDDPNAERIMEEILLERKGVCHNGIHTSTGAFADWPEADAYLAEILAERKNDPRAIDG